MSRMCTESVDERETRRGAANVWSCEVLKCLKDDYGTQRVQI